MRVMEIRANGQWQRIDTPFHAYSDPEMVAQNYTETYQVSVRVIEITEKVVGKYKPTPKPKID